jgi:hypothetical protein
VRAVYWDFALIAAYGVGLAGLCLALAGTEPGLRRASGRVAAWGVIVATALDAVENVGLLHTLGASSLLPAAPWPRLTQACATAKFGLLAAAVAYCLGVGAWAYARTVSWREAVDWYWWNFLKSFCFHLPLPLVLLLLLALPLNVIGEGFGVVALVWPESEWLRLVVGAAMAVLALQTLFVG